MARQIQAEVEIELHKFEQHEELEQHTRLNNEMRQQTEIEFQQQMQGLQPSKQTNQKVVSDNYQSTRYDNHHITGLPICWRCGKVCHMKKDCTNAFYCTNCGKNNHHNLNVEDIQFTVLLCFYYNCI